MARAAFQMVKRQGMEWIESVRLARESWLQHAFSTRAGGTSRSPAAGLNLGFIESDAPANVKKNRRRFFAQLLKDDFALAEVRQIHSATAYQVVRNGGAQLEYLPSGFAVPGRRMNGLPQGDALITHEPGIVLSVRSADCMPVLLADRRQRAVAAIHAGWRGALAGVVEITVGEMVRLYGTNPCDLVAAVGPSIRACCYRVGDEVVNAFCGRYPHGEAFFRAAPHDRVEDEIADRYPLLFLTQKPPGHGPDATPTIHLDLVAVARDQLTRAGLKPSQIHVADYCTACRTDIFFSHRKEGPATGRMMAIVSIV